MLAFDDNAPCIRERQAATTPVPLNADAVRLVRKWLGKHTTHVLAIIGPISPIFGGTIYGTPG